MKKFYPLFMRIFRRDFGSKKRPLHGQNADEVSNTGVTGYTTHFEQGFQEYEVS